MDADEFLCIRCARHMRTCCQRCQIHVTPGDVGRIAAYTARRDFHEYRLPDDPTYEDQDDDVAWLENVFRADGTRRVLKRTSSGDCTFLGPHGCVLPLEVRPLVCRIYPFEYDDQGVKPNDELSHGCPLELLRPGQGLLQALDMHRQDAERWHAQLYQEIRLNHGSPVDDETGSEKVEMAHCGVSESLPEGGVPAGGASCESA